MQEIEHLARSALKCGLAIHRDLGAATFKEDAHRILNKNADLSQVNVWHSADDEPRAP